MPIITFKNVDDAVIKAASIKLPELLSKSMSVPVEHIKFINEESKIYHNGLNEEKSCIINVNMIDKGPQVRTVVATILTEFMKSLSVMQCLILFNHIKEDLYYIDGKRFDQL